jgi:hypothetical protein
MNLRFPPAVSWLAVLGAFAATPASMAQQQGTPSSDTARQSQATPAQPTSPGAKAAPEEAATGAGYRSAFEGYRRHAEEPVLPWAKSNEIVGQIGGWKAYAREAAGEAVPSGPGPATPASAPPGVSATPGTGTPAGHEGHKK